MIKKAKSVLIVGFNTRPLAYSLNKAGYDVFVVDFFGDIDLYPCVKDSVIISKRLGSNYSTMKENYSEFLARFSVEMLQEHLDIDYLIIGSGLDDAFKERQLILNETLQKDHDIISLNNDIQTLTKARTINVLYQILESHRYKVPRTQELKELTEVDSNFKYPFIIKKKTGSGGLNIYKINNKNELNIKLKQISPEEISNWLIQEYIEGLPISCTVISNGIDCEIISINRQIVGFDFVNAPKEFMYCGNVVPGNILPREEELVKDISLLLTRELKLKGINGFDYVLKNNYPYLMEINPRIPGSIRVSEEAMQLNLLELHILSFNVNNWKFIKDSIKSAQFKNFVTKLIYFAPKTIHKNLIQEINKLEHVHDKSEPKEEIHIGEPICTILYNDNNFDSSYFGALKIVDKIERIIN